MTDVSGRVRSAEFMKLPTREELPDYYDVIEEPMDLNTIAPRVAASEYATFDDFSADMDKVFNNAMTFNDPGSLVSIERLHDDDNDDSLNVFPDLQRCIFPSG